MKKNRMMRLASMLLVAVMMTTCTISGTFAKYVTSGSATDSARVAKWGVSIDAQGETFAKEYAKDDTTFTVGTNTVISTDKVVAPGTKGNMASMKLTGTPEVAVRVSYEGKFDISDNWKDRDGNYYCPLEIKIEDTVVQGRNFTSADNFEKTVNNKIAEYSQDYAAGTDLSTKNGDSLEISWNWPFSTSAENDVKDTDLGNQAVIGNAAVVTLEVITTVTQID